MRRPLFRNGIARLEGGSVRLRFHRRFHLPRRMRFRNGLEFRFINELEFRFRYELEFRFCYELEFRFCFELEFRFPFELEFRFRFDSCGNRGNRLFIGWGRYLLSPNRARNVRREGRRFLEDVRRLPPGNTGQMRVDVARMVP
ncbi:MAG: hypothetical protein WBM29_13110 [Candidatus Deferrimicrobium sp.]